MPYKIDTEHKILPKIKWFDRRYKLTLEDREDILKVFNEWNVTQTYLALKYNISRKTIYYILNPDKLIIDKENYKIRAKWWVYYNKENQKLAMRETRRYRYKIKDQLI